MRECYRGEKPMRTPSTCCLLAVTLTIALAGCAKQDGDTTTAIPGATTTPSVHPTPPAPGSTRNEVMIRKAKNALVINKVNTAKVGGGVNGGTITLTGGVPARARKSRAVTAAKEVPKMTRDKDQISFASSSQPGWALMYLTAAAASSRINLGSLAGDPPPVQWGVRGFSSRAREPIRGYSSRALSEPIFGTAISLEIQAQQSLFLLLAAEGTVNRMGAGAVDNPDRELYVRDTQEPLFHRFMESVPGDILAHPGIYTCPGEPRGKPCKLTILFALSGNREIRLCFLYGAESTGPPQEIRDLVNNAMRLTEPWLQQFKSDIARRRLLAERDPDLTDWKEVHQLLSQAGAALPESSSTARSLILRAKGIADEHLSAGGEWRTLGTLVTNADSSISLSSLVDARRKIAYALVIAAGHLPSGGIPTSPRPGETSGRWSSGSKPWPTPWTRTAP
jgi:hypothetical protein